MDPQPKHPSGRLSGRDAPLVETGYDPPQLMEKWPSKLATSTIWMGTEPPTLTMRTAAETASKMDREWFDSHPGLQHLIRWSIAGEFPPPDLEEQEPQASTAGRNGRWVVSVVLKGEGARLRSNLIYIEGSITDTPIPFGVWGAFYEIATSESRVDAIGELISAFENSISHDEL